MTERDIRMATLQECAADAVCKRYGNLPKYGAGRVAEAIRELMKQAMDETPSGVAVVVDQEPYL